MRVLEFFLDLLFPPKCILCSRLLQHQETDLCKTCRLEADMFRTQEVHHLCHGLDCRLLL